MARIVKKDTVNYFLKSFYWFAVGFLLSGAFLSSLVMFYFQYQYRNRVIPGVFIGNTYVGEKTKDQIQKLFTEKNNLISQNSFSFKTDDQVATVSAKELGIGYDTNLMVDQSLSLGKGRDLLSDAYIILSTYLNGTFLRPSYTYNEDVLKSKLSKIEKNVQKDPVNAEFNVENNKVVAFKQSSNGQLLDYESLNKTMRNIVPNLLAQKPSLHAVNLPIKIIKPDTTTEEANSLGIVEPIGVGTSTFYHSIPGRVHNVALATSKINGALVAPGEEFSFDKTLGDVSAYTGYAQAYVISGGKTVLGDGGGVCQVSTTLFRAVLNAGLPITERHAHAYRVGYYEQDAPPGLDATTYVPTVDFKFKNDTGHYIFIQALADTDNLSLTFTIYGKSDGRKVSISQPVISDTSPAPPDVYQDDPTLPVGTIKQVDFAAPGAKSVFTRTVTRDGKQIIKDTFVSIYKPWQAVFLRGTKTI
ncbi:MAG TPA: VanW family protein [Patescibacteria group bacterium]|nr:VanW family protein [Patescibacteria group bacterium]